MPRPIRSQLLALSFSLAMSVAALAAPCPTFRIGLEEAGIYRVDYAGLAASGLGGELPSAEMSLAENGRPVPIWINDGGDGRFGPGDHFEFRGERLVAEGTGAEELTSTHVYVLSCAEVATAARMRRAEARADVRGTAGRWLLREHLESDLILVRLPEGDANDELWFWHKLASSDAVPFEVPISLAGLEDTGGRSIAIRLHLRGWSKPAAPVAGFPDHRVEVAVDGRLVATLDWNQGEGGRTFELPPIAASSLAGRTSVGLSLRVPHRSAPGGALFADVSLLDWIEVEIPHSGRVEVAPIHLTVDPQSPAGPLPIAASGPVHVYGDDGSRTEIAVPAGRGLFELSPSAHAFDLVPSAALARPASPVSIELDRPSTWRSAEHQADLLIVGPADLLAAATPLAERRRSQGLSVELVDVQDIYDEWSYGHVDPRAIQAFVAHAFKNWRPPAPRYLLLVGDASWDPKNPAGTETEAPDAVYSTGHGTEFAHAPATSYRGLAGGRARNRVPTWSYPTGDGHAAGDNYFVDVDGDLFPELAVGRFPVVTAEEVAAIVEKIRRYEEVPPGPWRRQATFVTSEDPGWKMWADDLAERAAAAGFEPFRVYAPPLDEDAARSGDPANTERTDAQAVAAALGRGGFLLHFVGHGGRFVWRTGPADWQRQRDLFNLDDLDHLPELDRLPIVLSMTCYSAPFDHPSADSIGEKLLRLPGRGAIAVLAASWRNSPTQLLSQIVVGEFLAAGTGDRLGDVVLRAKKRSFNRDFLRQYNLLGDPSLPLSSRP